MIRIIDLFRLHWRSYVLQSFLAVVILFPLLLLLTLQHAVIMASIGATAFIVFAMPKSITAQPRNVIGGQLMGLFSGYLFSLLPHSPLIFSIAAYSLAVGFSLFLMVATDTEHPPAAATALGTAIAGFSWSATIAIIVSIIVLSVVHHFFSSHLKDLILQKAKPMPKIRSQPIKAKKRR